MTTYDTLAVRLRTKLTAAAGRDRLSFLDESMTTTTTSVVLDVAPGNDVRAGTIIEIGHERMYVRSVATATLTVRRGFDGTTATSHADDAEVRISPRYPLGRLTQELADVTRSLPRGLFCVATTTVTMESGGNSFDLTDAAGRDVLRVLVAWRTNANGVEKVYLAPQLSVIRHADTTAFPSGYAVTIPPAWTYTTDATVRVTYAYAPVTTSIAPTTDLTTHVGLPESLADALVFAAGARLLLEKEAERNDTRGQTESRFADEVPATALTQISDSWQRFADRRISEEMARLLEVYPYRTSDR